MGLKDWFTGFKDPFPSFAELRERNRASARALSRSEAYTRIEQNKILSHPASVAQRKEILRLISGPFDETVPEQCQELLSAALGAQNYLLRPGSVEDVWILEGLIDRVLHT